MFGGPESDYYPQERRKYCVGKRDSSPGEKQPPDYCEFLRMHRGEVKSRETKQHFGEAINRIMAMSLIHQNLYSGKELSNIDFEGYLRQLSNEIITSTGNEIRYNCNIQASVDRIGLK